MNRISMHVLAQLISCWFSGDYTNEKLYISCEAKYEILYNTFLGCLYDFDIFQFLIFSSMFYYFISHFIRSIHMLYNVFKRIEVIIYIHIYIFEMKYVNHDGMLWKYICCF